MMRTRTPKKKKKKAKKPKIATKKRGRDARGRLLPEYTIPGGGRPKGAFSLSSVLRESLKRHRGDRTAWQCIVDRFVDLLITGTDFKHARTLRDGIQLITDRLEGRPAQTIVADVTRREDPVGRLPSEERETLLRRYLKDFGVEGIDA